MSIRHTFRLFTVRNRRRRGVGWKSVCIAENKVVMNLEVICSTANLLMQQTIQCILLNLDDGKWLYAGNMFVFMYDSHHFFSYIFQNQITEYYTLKST